MTQNPTLFKKSSTLFFTAFLLMTGFVFTNANAQHKNSEKHFNKGQQKASKNMHADRQKNHKKHNQDIRQGNHNRYDNRNSNNRHNVHNRNHSVRNHSPSHTYHYNSHRHGWGNVRPVYNRQYPGWQYAHYPRRNTVFSTFSFPFVTIQFGGHAYRYCDGVYFRPYNNNYRVVAAPVGIIINVLPFGYNRFYIHNAPYYYFNGTYYEPYKNSYRVVSPPLGALVESIPDGYETIVIDGETYYIADDVQYKPTLQDNGEIWFEVIKTG